MGNNRKYSNRSKGRSKNNKSELVKDVFIPEALKSGIVIFDEDEFYGQFIDIVLFGFDVSIETVKIANEHNLKRFKRTYSKGDYTENIYLIDELFLNKKIDIPGFISKLKEYDEKARIVGLTALADGDIIHKEIFDKVVVKSRKNNELTIAAVLSELLGIDINREISDTAE